MFGRTRGDRSGGREWDPELGVKLERITALPVSELGVEVMTLAFGSGQDPENNGRLVEEITEAISPTPRISLLRDTTIRAQRQAAQEAADPDSDRAKWNRLNDIVGEGMQALEKALLVTTKTRWTGVTNEVVYVATRLGREALEQSAVDRILTGGTL